MYPSKESKVISTSAKSSIVEPVLQGSSAIAQLAGPMGLDHQNIPGCSSWPELASTVRLPRQMQPLHSHLTNTAFIFMQATEERGIWKKKKWSLSWFTFFKQLSEVIASIYLFFTIIIPSQYSMITVRDAWRARVVTVFGTEQTRVPTERLATCQLDAPAKRRRKCNCRPYISNASNSKPFSSPHHLGLAFIFS